MNSTVAQVKDELTDSMKEVATLRQNLEAKVAAEKELKKELDNIKVKKRYKILKSIIQYSRRNRVKNVLLWFIFFTHFNQFYI